MALDDSDLPRYRDLLTSIAGAPELVPLEGATVFDLSPDPASPFALGFLLIGLGARRVSIVTDTPFADPSAAARDLSTALQWLRAPARPLAVRTPSARQLTERFDGFDVERLAGGDVTALDAARLRHEIATSDAWGALSEAADLVLSFSLLEHLPGSADTVARLARLGRPGSLGIHLIDLVDHAFYRGAAADPDTFLEASAAPTSDRGNRLRFHQWVDLFESGDFEVVRAEQWASRPAPSEARIATFAEPFRTMRPEQLTPTGGRVYVRRRGAEMRRETIRTTGGAIVTPSDHETTMFVERDLAAKAYATLLSAAQGAVARDYLDLAAATPVEETPLVTVVAFYLPQFHPIPENDAAWGRGFTEWTNVSKAVPQFDGHDQPRLPGELGFYDLRLPEVQRRQAALARRFGISAFCFHYYWFSGRRLLERPLAQFMADASIGLDFCVCWANEPWTRRWDGRDDHVLVAQEHTADGDAAFIDDVADILRHPRYLRIDGRPVIVVYRPGLMPDPKRTADAWRRVCRATGVPDPYLIVTDAFETVDPRAIGFDAAVEFPPNTAGRPLPVPITDARAPISREYAGVVYRYADMWRWRAERPEPDYELFRTVCPGFDNEARRPGAGSTYVDASPDAYRRWLSGAGRHALAAQSRDRRLVFVNAWNEWAEGAYLEPDRRHGYAYLDATSRALNGLRDDWTLLVVSHDACRGGAQQVLLSHLAWWRRHTGIRCVVVCLAEGEWWPRFQALAETRLLSDLEALAAERGDVDLREVLLDVCGGAPALMFVNSVASARALPSMAALGVPIVTEVHELASSIERYAGPSFQEVLTRSTELIACGEPVRRLLVEQHGRPAASVTTVSAALEPRDQLDPTARDGKRTIREALNLPTDGTLVVGSGIGMPFRKGADLFIEVARLVATRRSDIAFVWIGEFPGHETDPTFGRWQDVLSRAQAEGLPIRFTGTVDDVAPYLRAADLFLMTSREEPFGLVVLEAAACGVPSVCFEGASGAATFVAADAGVAVPLGDVPAMADAVMDLIDHPARRDAMGEVARARWASQYTPDAVAPALLRVCRRVAGKAPTVSVIVPNYNHARYLQQRLDSILAQSFRDVEILVLDDASTDGSRDVIERYRHRADVRVIVSAHNSGSPFRQWLKGLDATTGEFVWIAESDDACAPDFLETMVGLLRDPLVRVAYANSSVWNDRGEVTGDYSTMPYLTDLSHDKWRNAYRVPATREVNDGFGVKNTILTASAAVFRRFALGPQLRDDLATMRIAGDWRFFAEAMAGGDVAYCPRALNHHRRHDESVVGRLLRERRTDAFWREFAAAQRWIVEHYRLDDTFTERWECYLRAQWDAFFPGRPFAEMATAYPLDEMRARIQRAGGAPGRD